MYDPDTVAPPCADALGFPIRWEHETNLMACTVVVLLFCAHDWLGSHLHLVFYLEKHGIAQWADSVRYVSFSLMDAGTSAICHLLCQVCEERLLCFRSVSVDSLSRFLRCCARRCPLKGSRSIPRRFRPVCDSIPPVKRLTLAACRSISYPRLKQTKPWSCLAAGASKAFRSSI